MKKLFLAAVIAFGGMTAFSVYASTQEPCNEPTTCEPAPCAQPEGCTPAPCNQPAPCDTVPCNPAPCNPGC